MREMEAVVGLRAWAAGSYETEAAVELLIRSSEGRLADPRWPWIVADADRYALDTAEMTRDSLVLCGGDRRVLAIVQALLTGGPLWAVGGLLADLDRQRLIFVLAALAHAAGSHEQLEPVASNDWLSLQLAGPVVPWPATPEFAA